MFILWVYQLSHAYSPSTDLVEKVPAALHLQLWSKEITSPNFVKVCMTILLRRKTPLQQTIRLISHLCLNITSFCWTSARTCLSDRFSLGCVISKSEHRYKLFSKYSKLAQFQPVPDCNTHGCNTSLL